MNDFKCTSCGACCKMLTKEFLDEHKMPEHPSGGCGHLLPDKTCAIYNTRPEICNVRVMWEKRYSEFSWDAFKRINEEACKVLEKEMRAKYGDT